MSGFAQSGPGSFGRVVSTAIYSRQAISKAQSAFKQHCAVTVRPAGQGEVSVTIRPIGDAAALPARTVLEFWNFVLDTEAQRRLALE